ncbi:hypothetical protein ACSBR1_009127 [Camellia fascicularis]
MVSFGHKIPFLELSKLIAQKGHTVSFVCTPRNIDRLPKLPPNLAPLTNLVKLQLPKVDKLPDNAESTIDLPYDEVKYLKMAYDQLQQPMTQILADLAPDWVIYACAPYWLGPIATRLGIFSACFPGPVQVLKGLSGEGDRNTPEDFTVPPKWIPFKSNIAFRLFEIKRIFEDVSTANDENVPVTYSEQASKLKPIIPVGQLPTTGYDSCDNDEAWIEMKEWLDKQPQRSVRGLCCIWERSTAESSRTY